MTDLAASALAAKRRSLDRQLAATLATPSRCDLTQDLQAEIGRSRNQLLVLLDHPSLLKAIGNQWKQALRSDIVHSKVTNECRVM